MEENNLSVRKIQPADIELIIQYWLGSDHDYLEGMGVDVKKLFKKEEISEMLLNQMKKPYEQKNAYCIIWEIDGKPAGHCNTNPSQFGNQANMHLHLWQPACRQKGHGSTLLK